MQEVNHTEPEFRDFQSGLPLIYLSECRPFGFHYILYSCRRHTTAVKTTTQRVINWEHVVISAKSRPILQIKLYKVSKLTHKRKQINVRWHVQPAKYGDVLEKTIVSIFYMQTHWKHAGISQDKRKNKLGKLAA